MDSNNHFVDWGMFWKNIQGKKERTFCGSLFDLEQLILADTKIATTKYVILSIGVNDVDTKTAEEVRRQLETVIDLIDRKYGQPKIIVGELTPRRDDRDDEVKKCNELINQFTDGHERLFLAKQDKLRTQDGRHFYDTKHITKYAVPIYISSLKNSLRAARGIERNETRRNPMRGGAGNHNYNNYNYNNNNNNNNYNNNHNNGRFINDYRYGDNRGRGRGGGRGGRGGRA